jgi:hypothetical protein
MLGELTPIPIVAESLADKQLQKKPNANLLRTLGRMQCFKKAIAAPRNDIAMQHRDLVRGRVLSGMVFGFILVG